MTREESFAKLKKLAEEESTSWNFISFLEDGRTIVVTHEDKTYGDKEWLLGQSTIRAMIRDSHEIIAKINNERDQINVTLAMGITDTEVGGEED